MSLDVRDYRPFFRPRKKKAPAEPVEKGVRQKIVPCPLCGTVHSVHVTVSRPLCEDCLMSLFDEAEMVAAKTSEIAADILGRVISERLAAKGVAVEM